MAESLRKSVDENPRVPPSRNKKPSKPPSKPDVSRTDAESREEEEHEGHRHHQDAVISPASTGSSFISPGAVTIHR
ncbi:hypothetical protein [Chondromyces crocatus]|uniref:Uncharacterized protein n=1 Tax=Chondromyces crocatus TaxID=52 RepID=A0A0K1EMB2_CHOCO|nr:hypothetical protein [Chondromyces crocatus]AKT41758.1 uncharacterized protein CMC5_059690 [Chondromyces crocatus]